MSYFENKKMKPYELNKKGPGRFHHRVLLNQCRMSETFLGVLVYATIDLFGNSLGIRECSDIKFHFFRIVFLGWKNWVQLVCSWKWRNLYLLRDEEEEWRDLCPFGVVRKVLMCELSGWTRINSWECFYRSFCSEHIQEHILDF